MEKKRSQKKSSTYIRRIWHKLQDLEKKLNDFEVVNSKEHEELRKMINGLGESKDEQNK